MIVDQKNTSLDDILTLESGSKVGQEAYKGFQNVNKRWAEEHERQVESHLGVENGKKCRSIDLIFDQAFKCCVQGKYVASADYFRMGEWEKRRVKEQAIVYVLDMFTLPRMAYYYYRVNNHAFAEQYLVDTIILGEKLEKDIPIIHLNRIDQMLNLSRMLFKSGQTEKAVAVISQTLQYLCRNRKPTIFGEWNEEARLNLNEDYFLAMFKYLFFETVKNLNLAGLGNDRAVFQEIFDPIELAAIKDNSYWEFKFYLYLKSLAFRSFDEDKYLEELFQYFSRTSHYFSILKMDLLSGLYRNNTLYQKRILSLGTDVYKVPAPVALAILNK